MTKTKQGEHAPERCWQGTPLDCYLDIRGCVGEHDSGKVCPLHRAAPDLLAACELLVAIYGDDDTEATDQAKQAIAKAKAE